MKIRFCNRDDYKGVVACLWVFWEVALNEKEFWVILYNRFLRGVHTFVAVDENNKVLGTASIFIEPKFNRKFAGHIEDVAVHPDHQRQGVATALCQHLIDYARKAGCYKVILNCKSELTPFYSRLGFSSHEHGMRLDLRGDDDVQKVG